MWRGTEMKNVSADKAGLSITTRTVARPGQNCVQTTNVLAIFFHRFVVWLSEVAICRSLGDDSPNCPPDRLSNAVGLTFMAASQPKWPIFGLALRVNCSDFCKKKFSLQKTSYGRVKRQNYWKCAKNILNFDTHTNNIKINSARKSPTLEHFHDFGVTFF